MRSARAPPAAAWTAAVLPNRRPTPALSLWTAAAPASARRSAALSRRAGVLLALRAAAAAAAAPAGAPPVSAAEEEANEKRRIESGGGIGPTDAWRWTLNWDVLEGGALAGGPPIIIGSCPRSPGDVQRIATESGADAILCLQSGVCHEALGIAYGPIRARALELGMLPVHCPMLDFSHSEQSALLPEAVRALAALRALDKTVYVHCSAGINRATLTTVGYLSFVLGEEPEAAAAAVRAARPQAHPYMDCLYTARARMLEGRGEEVKARARALFEARAAARAGGEASGSDDDGPGDWHAAEAALIQSSLRRGVDASLGVTRAVQEEAAGRAAAALDAMAAKLAAAQAQLAELRACGGEGAEECTLEVVDALHTELLALRSGMAAVASMAMLSDDEGAP